MTNLVNVTEFEVEADFSDSVRVWQLFLKVVNHLSDVMVMGTIKHDFPGGGFSGLILLAESHAAIHTWPERNKAWCELATCGDPKDCETFRSILSNQHFWLVEGVNQKRPGERALSSADVSD